MATNEPTTDLEDDDEEMTECESFGCDDEVVHKDDDGTQYECRRCGAEWWEEP